MGFQQAREWLQAGRAAVLVEAMDGSPAERARLIGGSDATVVGALTAAELGGVFGRDHAVHVAVAPGRLAQTIVAEAARWRGVSAPAKEELRKGGGNDRATRRAAGQHGSPDGDGKRSPQGSRTIGSPDGGSTPGSPDGGRAVRSRPGDSATGSPRGGSDERSPRGGSHRTSPHGDSHKTSPRGDGRTGQV
ncbi:hypothetical protein ACE7GA_10475 [Roseomonas sp. CCTCC AB2023176]|uniref:hypothetical protein n=1 Tax=Roseomonas sp. CCTCC AB2023176 TaxID=3342640 RepID=UPI0035D674EF